MANKNANRTTAAIEKMVIEREHNQPRLYKRIVFLLLVPVVIVGISIAGILTHYLHEPTESFLIKNLEANLRIAAKLGLGVCETHFNQLLDMRLEDNIEMNAALKTEAMEQIKAISRQFPNIHMLVLKEKQTILVSSLDYDDHTWRLPDYYGDNDAIIDTSLGQNSIKAHIQYFPFWDWHIISFIHEADFLAPINMARLVIYLSTIGVLVAVLLTLVIVFHFSVRLPLNRLIEATEAISKGDLEPIETAPENEIGQLTAFFNNMVGSLKKKTEEASDLINQLKESEARYRVLVELSPEAIFVQQDGVVKYVNRRGARNFGAADPQEMIGMRVMDLIHPDYRGIVRSRISKAYDERATVPAQELKCLKLDKTVIDVISSGTYLDYSGKPAMLSVIRDITQQKRAERILRESEEKQARSKKMESLGLLAGGVAHDLNNVLSGIVSYPELILMDLPEDSKFRKSIETIQDSGKRAAAIVHDLLTVARGVATSKEPLNLNDLVNAYLDSPEFLKLKQLFPSVSVRTDLESDLFNISGSLVHYRKVLMNLVSNAVEAIQGGGEIRIKTMNRYIDRPLRGYDDVTIGEYAILSVTDNGSGISPEDLKHIFEPFYTKKVMGRSGTGLGLAMVWNIVQDHNGYIDVRTSHNGTTFELYFPITRADLVEKDLPVSIEEYKGNGETILVVDDVKSQQEIACQMLEKLGYVTTAVSSGEEAVEYLQTNSVDLILLDMIMDPGMNGRETYRLIKKTHPDQKAIIVSGFAHTEDVKKAQEFGAGQYLRKPVSFGELGVAVKAELAG